MTDRPQLYSTAHLRRQRDSHAQTDGYGRHRHVYLQDRIQRLVRDLRAQTATTGLAWLDYGCGKGTFIEQIQPLGLFSTAAGYDPAVDEYQQQPEGRFDLVTCLDVLDIAEPRFVPAILSAIAALTDRAALFDCLTRPKPGATMRPHPPYHWTNLVGQVMTVLDTVIEFPGLEGFERVLILAAPQGSPTKLRLSSA